MLEGVVADLGVLRYTPAGLPHMEFQLLHQSRQEEAGAERDVTVCMAAVALGKPAQVAASLKAGQTVVVKGFLSQRSLKSDYPVLHVNQIKLLQEENHATSTR
ncbi:MAG TPA: primosomal replication protein N [Burkholderiales bacterium]|nr:primosomal replication protein N [Burkholderiales bacterium]